MAKLKMLVALLSFLMIGCSNSNLENHHQLQLTKLRTENDSLKTEIIKTKEEMKNQMIRSLTFQDGNAEKAMNFFVELFDNSKIINVKRWGKEQPEVAGKIMQATFELDGNLFMCSDSPAIHEWDFTPAVAMYIECESEQEIEKLYAKLSENGLVMMSIDFDYGFSKKFGFVKDQFGVSWQLNFN